MNTSLNKWHRQAGRSNEVHVFFQVLVEKLEDHVQILFRVDYIEQPDNQ